MQGVQGEVRELRCVCKQPPLRRQVGQVQEQGVQKQNLLYS